MIDSFIGMGSNLGDSSTTLLRAWRVLGEHEWIELKTLSKPYTSTPVDMLSDNLFTNAVGRIKTSLSPTDLLKVMLQTEKLLGRVRDVTIKGYQDRVVDLDLIYYGNQMINDPNLTVPHPHLNKRLFVLAPLASIAPDFIDPSNQQSIKTLHDQLVEQIQAGETEKQEITPSNW